MTAGTAVRTVLPRRGVAVSTQARAACWALHDVWVLTRRTLVRVVRTPEQLLNVTVQPLVLVLLFSFVFDGAFAIPGLTDYRDYLIAGVFAVTMGGTAQGTAIGLAVDLDTGLVDRLRSLPMARSSVLVGRTLADLCLSVVAGAVTIVAGLAIGWRIDAGPGGVVVALALALLFGYAASWAGVGIGVLARGPEAAQAVGTMVVLPLSLTSNAFISVDHMTPWLREVAVWNPISVLAAACRDLLGDPNPAAALPDWPMRHPVLASDSWSAVLLALLVPAAAALYRRRAAR